MEGNPLLCNQQDHHYVGRYPVYNPLEGWNRVETIVHSSESAVHLVNGKIRNPIATLADSSQKSDAHL
jgi:hypothetical protein